MRDGECAERPGDGCGVEARRSSTEAPAAAALAGTSDTCVMASAPSARATVAASKRGEASPTEAPAAAALSGTASPPTCAQASVASHRSSGPKARRSFAASAFALSDRHS
ncbi:hypothetical protein [Candidatus Palauibacter sp.]|uniref:hypothetical protein n=1 Tax=Candidatus Palauibacter sp. TaxID=3101350 RepID=UPI003AF1E75D